MRLRYMIKCDVGFMDYMYWNGVEWVKDIKRARVMDKKFEAEKELESVSPPRNAVAGKLPHVFSM